MATVEPSLTCPGVLSTAPPPTSRLPVAHVAVVIVGALTSYVAFAPVVVAVTVVVLAGPDVAHIANAAA